ncbi:hypothetical protein EDM53_03885 [Rickettsiales endosymbiont of Peranema trichophorum]|uniref:CBU_0592 family membrane protein n=1 Tax=Rickettsiales endosymbiont of Peranema trichophorum TaxID=2486577 RepID=UPI0010D6BDB8|nr:hypothetical protein [Rickettsiales endosymbiont of Peranema trichophorum]RZI46723.1 hypothetical protein EDM53_03885 [Rickettsiales endosymbiont of Peranema trichophorum]
MLNIMNIKYSDVAGLIGVLILLTSYLLIQLDRINVKELTYSVMNMCGALFIMVSLLVDWNLSSMVIEVIWFLISVYGICRCLRKKVQ